MLHMWVLRQISSKLQICKMFGKCSAEVGQGHYSAVCAWINFYMKGLHPWLVKIWRVVWNSVCPSITVSVIKWISKLDTMLCVVKRLTCWWNVLDAVSCCRCVFIFVASLGPDVVLAVLFISWQWHLGLFKFVWICLSLLQWGGSVFPGISVRSICVYLIAVAATSLFSVLDIPCSVGNHFWKWELSTVHSF